MSQETSFPAGEFPGQPEKKEIFTDSPAPMHRRQFVGTLATSAMAFTILPRHVLGGKGYVAPSDTLTLAHIGMGTEGIREMLPLLTVPGIRITAVCDCNKTSYGYRDWSATGLREEVRQAIRKSDWDPGGGNTVPGGLDNGKSIVDSFYANVHPEYKLKGCAAYADFRELFAKEKFDAVKIMTPDHSHGMLALTAIKHGKHAILHKPLSNRLTEARAVVELAKNSKVTTHLMPWDSNGSMEPVMNLINSGAIGTLKEIHNWTNRPVWPQYPTLPEDKPAVPDGLNWDIWVGPEADRPYHPNYTNMVFRGWYDFGSGCMGDMGYYSLWTVFNALKLENPTLVEPNRSHVVSFHEPTPYRIQNDFSFPMASKVRFRFPANGSRGPVDLFWYDGGMRPAVPDRMIANDQQFEEEGMMFVGDKDSIICEYHVGEPQLLSKYAPVDPNKAQGTSGNFDTKPMQEFVAACKAGRQTAGSFRDAQHIADAVNLYGVALRSGKTLKFDSAAGKITNLPDLNKWLSRDYRSGFNPAAL